MKKSVKIAIILFFLLLELTWAAWPRLSMHGEVLDNPYRNTERRAVLFSWRQHPTPQTESAYNAEITLLQRHMLGKAVAILVVGIVIDAVGIYMFWKHVPTKTAA